MERLNVMIVDDSSVATHVLSSYLTKLGHKVVRIARTGAEAIKAYKACNPDVVIMDITMPDMDGIAATEKIIASYPDSRIVVATSHTERNVVLNARMAGAKYALQQTVSLFDHVIGNGEQFNLGADRLLLAQDFLAKCIWIFANR